jgi:hypothetical protein
VTVRLTLVKMERMSKLRRISDETIHERIFKACSIEQKSVDQQVSNLHSLRETDFDSVVASQLRPVRQSYDETIHAWTSRCVPREKTLVVGGLRTCVIQEKRISILL